MNQQFRLEKPILRHQIDIVDEISPNEFSSNDIVDETISNTADTIKDDTQTKRTSFTEKIAAMVGMKLKEKEEVMQTTGKWNSFRNYIAKTKQDEEQVTHGATANQEKQFHLSWVT